MGYDKNIVSSCSAISDFDIDTFQQLQPLQYSPNKIEEINSGMGGICAGDGYVLAHYMRDLMRHRASLEATLMSIVRLHTCDSHYSNNIPSPPWRGSLVSMAMDQKDDLG